MNNLSEKVSVKEAAEILGMSQQGVREHMKKNLFPVPIGYVTNPNGRYQYHIYKNMLNKHIGRDVPEPKKSEVQDITRKDRGDGE